MRHITVIVDWPHPCSPSTSEFCSVLSSIKPPLEMRLVFWTTSNFQLDTTGVSQLRAFYEAFDKEDESVGNKIYSPNYRPGKRAAAGQYKDRRPIGIWQLWTPEGELLGFTDYDAKESTFEYCPK